MSCTRSGAAVPNDLDQNDQPQYSLADAARVGNHALAVGALAYSEESAVLAVVLERETQLQEWEGELLQRTPCCSRRLNKARLQGQLQLNSCARTDLQRQKVDFHANSGRTLT